MYSNMSEENGSSIKVVVLGGPSTGKSSLIEQYVHQEFSDQHQPTKSCRVYCTTVTVNDSRLFDVEILDTPPVADFPVDSDQEWRSGLTGCGLRKADVYFVVLDVTSPQSYLTTQKLVRQVLASSKPESKIFVIANKYDLLENKGKKSTSTNPQLVQMNISRIFNTNPSNSPRSQQNFSPSTSDIISLPFNRLVMNFADGSLHQHNHHRHQSSRNRHWVKGTKTPTVIDDQNQQKKNSQKKSQKQEHFYDKLAKKCGKNSQNNGLILAQPNSIGNSNNTNLHNSINNANLEKNIPLLTCSAKFNWHVTAIFRQAIFSLQDNQNQQQQQQQCVSVSSNSLSNSPLPAMVNVGRRLRSSKTCRIQ